jgi:hypothetical protein
MMVTRIRSAFVICAWSALALSTAAYGQDGAPAEPPTASSRSQQVVERDIWVPAPPLHPCVVPELAGHVFESGSVPGGAEYLPGRCGGIEAASTGERTNLRGLTVSEALSRLVEQDARYRWEEQDGVFVVRPLEAWNDRIHFLHRTISVVFTDQNVGGALRALLTAIGPTRHMGEPRTYNTPDMNRQFSVALGTTSALNALNAVVRTHERLKWSVSYCQRQRRVEFAMVMLHTHDGGGLGGQPVGTLTDESGRSYDPCTVPSR